MVFRFQTWLSEDKFSILGLRLENPTPKIIASIFVFSRWDLSRPRVEIRYVCFVQLCSSTENDSSPKVSLEYAVGTRPRYFTHHYV